MNRFSRYAGSKMHLVERFNSITKDLQKKIYVEPFFGSGAIFFNLDAEYDLYVINDINEHVINSVRAFREGTYVEYVKEKDRVFAEFGDIRNDKAAYYNFRNAFNERHLGKKTVTEGFQLHFLMNACINSMLRFGPNGMNQSYGNRFFFMKDGEFDVIKSRLTKNVVITSEDYRTVIDRYDSADTLMFLDPPYFVRPEVGYSTSITENGLLDFLEFIKSLKGSVVYTDISCSIHDGSLAGWNKEDTKMLANISPQRRTETENQEVFYSNFKTTKKIHTLF
jgi:DNA adenine methylase